MATTCQLLFAEERPEEGGVCLDLVVLEAGDLAVHRGELVALGIVPLPGDDAMVQELLVRWADESSVVQIDLLEGGAVGIVLRRLDEEIVLRRRS